MNMNLTLQQWWLVVPDPEMVDRVVELYEDVMFDRTHRSRMGQSVLVLAKGIYSAVDKGRHRHLLPNWGLQAAGLGIPVIEDFQYIWIPANSLTQKYAIASGRNGQVFLGTYKDDDVIIKYAINPHVSYTRVIKEAAISAHMMLLGVGPPIVGLQEATADKSHPPAIIFRYFTGTITLSQMMRIIDLYKPEDVYHIVVEIAKNLNKMHQHNFLHNDVKADNIILAPSEDGRVDTVYFIDFGRASFDSEFCNRQRKVVHVDINKYPRIAPERALGTPETKMTDVFSFGYLVRKFNYKLQNKPLRYILQSVIAGCLEESNLRPTMDQIEAELCRKWQDLQ